MSPSGRSSVWQSTWFGTKVSKVRILSPRPDLIKKTITRWSFLLNCLCRRKRIQRTFGKKVRPAGERQTAVAGKAKRMSQGSEAQIYLDEAILSPHIFLIEFLFMVGLLVVKEQSPRPESSNRSLRAVFLLICNKQHKSLRGSFKPSTTPTSYYLRFFVATFFVTFLA